MEHRKDVLPPRLDTPSFGVDHLSYTAHHHVPYGDGTERETHRQTKGIERAGLVWGWVRDRRQVDLWDSLVSFHYPLKRAQEILLEPKVRQLSFLEKLHRQLSERVNDKEGNLFVWQAAHLYVERGDVKCFHGLAGMVVRRSHGVEVCSDDLPHTGPLQSHTVHVIVADLDDLLQREHPGVGGAGELLVGHGTQRLHKLNCSWSGSEGW